MPIQMSRLTAAALVVALVASTPVIAHCQTVREWYALLQQREQTARDLIASASAAESAQERDRILRRTRSVIASYESLARRHHASGYADNALFNAAALADAAYEKFKRPSDRGLASRFYRRLAAEYPSSSLVKRIPSRNPTPAAQPAESPVTAPPPLAAAAPAGAAFSDGRATLLSIDRSVLPEGVRITLALDREVTYREERLDGPSRVFFDLKDVQTAAALKDVVLRYPKDVVRQIRVGRHPDSTVRVVLDLEGVNKYSVFTMYHPFRVVVDCEPAAPTSAATTLLTSKTLGPRLLAPARPRVVPRPAPVVVAEESPVLVIDPATREDKASAPETPPPTLPSKNVTGGFSLSRQLGLGVGRIVIDPGHGGHDPGALGKGLNEADLTLDVALRLEKLLRQEGLDVVLTRRTDVYVPLDERTAIANRENADLFLSIHANASRNAAAGGVESYFLSFASSPEAEAVAARENSASSGGMHNLPDIIKAIALNNKLDESRDFAGMVQEALVSRLRRSNKGLRNLGVKKAPFVVLIGAQMPSVLAEISFLTNRQELQLLKTAAYKQRIAEALHASVMRYRRSLKGQGQLADK